MNGSWLDVENIVPIEVDDTICEEDEYTDNPYNFEPIESIKGTADDNEVVSGALTTI